jgi:hypothetical protein
MLAPGVVQDCSLSSSPRRSARLPVPVLRLFLFSLAKTPKGARMDAGHGISTLDSRQQGSRPYLSDLLKARLHRG